MFRGLVKDIKSAAASIVEQYLARASVAIPFVLAFGFATTALGLELAARFGTRNALWVMAAVFCGLGLLAASIVTMREREAAASAEERHADESGLAELGDMASEAAAHAAWRLPLSLLATLLASPSTSAATAARLLGRNLPLVLLLALVVLLFWPTEESPPDAEEETETDTAATPQETWPKEDAWREAA